MKLYIVDYIIPFPSSEYGGVQIVTAEDDKRAVACIMSYTGSHDLDRYPDLLEAAVDAVDRALVYDIQDQEEPNRLVYEFIT